jgi:hypothetical protein
VRVERLPSVALAVIAGSCLAQSVITSSFSMPICAEATANGPYHPGVCVPRFSFPASVPLPATGFPLGDLTMNNATGVVFHTNGPLIGTQNHPQYPAIGPTFPPFAGPAGMGALTGIAIDSAAGILWCTDGATCVGVAPVPGTPVIVPAFPLAPLGLLAPPVTGLDWDPVTGSLWAVTSGGAVYNFMPGPVALAPVMFPLPAIAGIPIVDIVIDRHPGAFPGIYVQAFGLIANYATGVISPTPPPLTPGIEDGIAYHSYPDILPSGCNCGSAVTVGTLGPATIGNFSFGFNVTGVPPFSSCILGIDVVSVLPPTSVFGCSLYLNPASSSLLLQTFTADGSGVATFPVPLTVPAGLLGFTAFAQWAYPCAASLALSDSQQFVLEAP